VNDGVPPLLERVLLWVAWTFPRMVIARREERPGYTDGNGVRWVSGDGGELDHHVTKFWRPLPAPPHGCEQNLTVKTASTP
jgi:hypothetical protein